MEEEDDLSADAARDLLKAREGHGPVQRLYRARRSSTSRPAQVWFTLSTVIIVAGIVSIILRGGLNLGIEFKGGTEWTIAAPGGHPDPGDQRHEGHRPDRPIVELLGTGPNQHLNVQADLNKLTSAQQSAEEGHGWPSPWGSSGDARSQGTPDHHDDGQAHHHDDGGGRAGDRATTARLRRRPPRSTNRRPTEQPDHGRADLGWSITNKAIEALIIFFVVVAAYISIRFEPKMALAAFIAMVHDVLVAVGIYSLFGFQVTPDTVVAILTILGYSLYHTVVVFDRVRDNTKGIGATGRVTYTQLIDLSMNQTLARSIDTSMVAIIPVLAMLLVGAQFLGATTLQSYGLALFVGLFSGAYSSIFIASPVLCMIKEREDRWKRVEHHRRRANARGWYSPWTPPT